MARIKFLKPEDMVHIEDILKRKLEAHYIGLERGFIVEDGDKTSCFLIVKADGGRYGVDAVAAYRGLDKQQSLYPVAVSGIKKYQRNFAFSRLKEADIFKAIEEMHSLDELVNAESFRKFVDIMKMSREEIYELASQNYDRWGHGIGGVFFGSIVGIMLYNVGKYLHLPIQDYANFWPMVAATGLLGGLIGTSVVARKIDKNYNVLKEAKLEEMADAIPAIKPKLH